MKYKTCTLLLISLISANVIAGQIKNQDAIVRTCLPNYNGQAFSYIVIDYHSWAGSCVYTSSSYDTGRSNPYQGPWQIDEQRNYWRCWLNADLCSWQPM